MESEKSGFVNKMSEIWRKMQVKKVMLASPKALPSYALAQVFNALL